MAERTADRREWDRLARLDAMWAIHSTPGTLHGWDDEAFQATGEAEVAAILQGLADAGLTPASERALDFGCGIGRLSRALASRFGAVTGVDFSPEMIERARVRNADLANCEFVVNDPAGLAVLEAGAYDFVLSLIALQHLASPDQIATYLRELCRVARPGAILVLQIPTAVSRRVAWHPLRLANAAARRARWLPEPLLRPLAPFSMRLTALPATEVAGVVRSAGAEVVTGFPDRRTGSDRVPSRVYVLRAGVRGR